MRPAFYSTLPTAVLGLLLVQNATAQVYQCLDTSGKKIFSQLPCAAQGGNSEKLVMRAPAAPIAAVPADGMPVRGDSGVLYGNGTAAAAPKNWAAENAAANARAAAADQAASDMSRHATPRHAIKSGRPSQTHFSVSHSDRQTDHRQLRSKPRCTLQQPWRNSAAPDGAARTFAN